MVCNWVVTLDLGLDLGHFLSSIQSVDTQTASPHRSSIQVLSHISVFSSISTIVAGLFLLRHQGHLRVNASSNWTMQTILSLCRRILSLRRRHNIHPILKHSPQHFSPLPIDCIACCPTDCVRLIGDCGLFVNKT